MPDQPTDALPVTIITGFLGSGKTTLLNRLLRHPELADTAVIVNEFGAVGLDHLLMEPAIEDAVLLANGCICCTVRGDIADTLDMLAERRAAGTIPPFRRVAIETTGLADPGPVAHAILDARAGFRLDGIIATLDAVHAPGQLARQPEARAQVALADRLVLTKADLADPAPARAAAAALNPVAPILETPPGPADLFDLGPIARPESWVSAPTGAHVTFRHAETIAATVLRYEAPIPPERLALWLDSLLSLRGERVLRVKGIVRLAGVADPVAIHAVHHVPHPAVVVRRAWSGGSRIVVIGRGLSAAGLRASFAAALEA